MQNFPIFMGADRRTWRLAGCCVYRLCPLASSMGIRQALEMVYLFQVGRY